MISLRPAADTDVPRIVELVQAAYRGQGGWTTEAHLVDGHRTDAAEVRAMLADPAVTLLVATGGSGMGTARTTEERATSAGAPPSACSDAATPAARRPTSTERSGPSSGCSRSTPPHRARGSAAASWRRRRPLSRPTGWTC